MKEHLNWWKNIGSYTKKVLQIRYFPAVHWEYLNEEQIAHIYNKEKN